MKAALLAAMITVESGGNDLARGRHGEIGPLQVRACVIADVNRIHGTRYRHSSMTNRAEAVEVCRLYLAAYCPGGTDEELARTWNGGPRGRSRRSTAAYWRRVEREMARR